MNKKIAVLLVITLLFAAVLVACDQTAEYEAIESKLPDIVYATEDGYVISQEETVKFGETVYYPLMTKMKNLEKSRIINGAFSSRGTKIGTNIEGNNGMVFKRYEILFESKDMFSLKFYAADKMNAQDEVVNFLFMASFDGKLFSNIVNIFGNADTNNYMDALFEVFNSYRVQQDMEELTLDKFYFAIVAFNGEDAKTMDIEISYLGDKQNTVVFPFSEIIEYLSEEDYDYFEFAR